MAILKYKDFEAVAELSDDMTRVRGKILYIEDLVTFESSDLGGGIQREFEEAVEDYLATCKALGREPKKPFKGVFQVRVTPEVHRKAATCAARHKTTLNDLMVKALVQFLDYGEHTERESAKILESIKGLSSLPAKQTYDTSYQLGPQDTFGEHFSFESNLVRIATPRINIQ
ncbi:type II toxin-antitoxin system HicB family antitoxin [Silvimonas soli]|uniref:type II toxin-antitoxin system HicB family antitoxin n=1 Tax=Silvimonas soli TaxID=2980100 RepID=UPI0024B35FDA|nr:type II toxin-antitoxin system HicB family antitoxin [Silvimonas soli]